MILSESSIIIKRNEAFLTNRVICHIRSGLKSAHFPGLINIQLDWTEVKQNLIKEDMSSIVDSPTSVFDIMKWGWMIFIITLNKAVKMVPSQVYQHVWRPNRHLCPFSSSLYSSSSHVSLPPHTFTPVNNMFIPFFYISVCLLFLVFPLSALREHLVTGPLVCPSTSHLHTHTYVEGHTLICTVDWCGSIGSSLQAPIHHTQAHTHKTHSHHTHTHTHAREYMWMCKHTGGCGDLCSVRRFISPSVCVYVSVCMLRGLPNGNRPFSRKDTHSDTHFFISC